MAAFLEACSKNGGSGGASAAATSTFSVASPEHPVTWDIASDNKAIADGLTPEQSATVNIYTYTDYLDPQALKAFEKKYKQYNVKCTITTFEDTTEALGKIRSGGVQADIFNPSYDQIGKLVKGGLIAPLNHSYIPNIGNVWPSFQNPFYDQGWRYTTPYTVYTTGIAWRTDKVSEDIGARANPYDVFWDPQYAKKLSVLDDYHTTMGMVAMRNGFDINTQKKDELTKIQQQLTQMNQTTMPKVNVTDYQDIPTGVVNLCQAWSGDAFNMLSYMPQGQSADVLRYWFPSDPTKGEVDNDLLVMLKMTQEPGHDAPVPQPHARLRRGLQQLHLHRLPAAADEDHAVQAGLATAPSRRTSPRSSSRSTCSARASACSSCRPPWTRSGRRSGSSSRPEPDVAPSVRLAGVRPPGDRLARSSCSSCPLYVVLALAFGTLDPMFLHPEPRPGTRCTGTRPSSSTCSSTSSAPTASSARRWCARWCSSSSPACGCLLIAYPVAYYVARFGGRRKGLLLALLIAPFWISYMMRMLAWVNLLQVDGWVNKAPEPGRPVRRARRLAGRAAARRWSSAWSTATCRT